MRRVRVLVSMVAFATYFGQAEAQWTGATYDTPVSNGYCSTRCAGASPAAAGTAVDLSNAYIGIASIGPNTPYPGIGTSLYTGSISLNKFASASTVTSQGLSILNLQTQSAVFASQMLSVTKELALISDQVAGLFDKQRATEKHAWIGSALASALVAVSPAEGKTNRLGFNMATVQGQSAMGLNYMHVSGAWDLNAGVAVSASRAKYVEGRVGFGFSW